MKDKTFHYKFDKFRNKIDDFLQTKCPFIYKLCIKCEVNEHYILRRFLSFPFGLLIGFIFYHLIVSRFDFPSSLEPLVKSTIITFMSLTYTVSIEMRTICWLILPTFTGRTGRSFLIALLVTLLAEGPLYNTIDNSGELFSSMACIFKIGFKHTKEKMKLIFEPIEQIYVNLLSDPPDTQNLTLGINTTHHIIFNMFKNKDQDKDQREDEEKNKTSFAKRVNCKLKKLCDTGFDDALKYCKDSRISRHFPWYIQYNLVSRLTIDGMAQIPALTNFFCQTDRINNFKEKFCNLSESGKEDDAYKALVALKGLASGHMKITSEFIKPDIPFNMTTIEELNNDIKVVFKTGKRYSNWTLKLLKKLLIVIFLLVFFSSKSYHNKYLRSLSFDNCYITTYFRRIDARRKNANKLTLLPLKRMERLELVYTFSFKLSPAEKSHAKTSTPLLSLLLIIVLTILFIDRIVYDLIDLLNKHLSIDLIQEGMHETNPTVEGIGFMARYMRTYVSKFKFSKSISCESTTQDCLPKPTLTENHFYIYIGLYFVSIVILNFTEMYFLRLRRIICGYFYPKRDKKRTLFLYNDRLKKRKGYLQYLTQKVRKIFREKKMKTDIGVNENYTLGILDYLELGFVLRCIRYILSRFVKKKCIVCEEKEGKNFHQCVNRECNLIYCDQCWNQCRQRCVGCRPTHFSDHTERTEDHL